MKLYHYWRSSASYRVRIALNLKDIDAELVPVDIVGEEHRGAAYAAIHPQGMLPALVDCDLASASPLRSSTGWRRRPGAVDLSC